MLQELQIPNKKVCVLDFYDTLFGVHSAVGKHDGRLGDITNQVSSLW